MEDIEAEELRIFAEQAQEDGYEAEFENGILLLTGHAGRPDISVIWEKGNVSWNIRNDEDDTDDIIIQEGELNYPESINVW